MDPAWINGPECTAEEHAEYLAERNREILSKPDSCREFLDLGLALDHAIKQALRESEVCLVKATIAALQILFAEEEADYGGREF